MENIRPHRNPWCTIDLKYRELLVKSNGKNYDLKYEQIKKKFVEIKSKFNKYYAISKKSGSGAAIVEDYYWLKENVEDICRHSETSFILKQSKDAINIQILPFNSEDNMRL
ncbi:unnamed protein product, partial [Gordionus sp. m RMFG-2023]